MERKAYRQIEVAQMLNVHKNTIYLWVKAGKIKTVKVGGIKMIPASEMERIERGD